MIQRDDIFQRELYLFDDANMTIINAIVANTDLHKDAADDSIRRRDFLTVVGATAEETRNVTIGAPPR